VETYSRVRQATDDNIIRRMRFACWITKATDTFIIFNTYCFSIATVVTRTRVNVRFVRTLPFLFTGISIADFCVCVGKLVDRHAMAASVASLHELAALGFVLNSQVFYVAQAVLL
jgi:hypothetical protein